MGEKKPTFESIAKCVLAMRLLRETTMSLICSKELNSSFRKDSKAYRYTRQVYDKIEKLRYELSNAGYRAGLSHEDARLIDYACYNPEEAAELERRLVGKD